MTNTYHAIEGVRLTPTDQLWQRVIELEARLAKAAAVLRQRAARLRALQWGSYLGGLNEILASAADATADALEGK